MNTLNRPQLPTDADIARAIARGKVLRSRAVTGAITRLATAPARWLDRLGHAGHAPHGDERPPRIA